jgi:hypothetical protein
MILWQAHRELSNAIGDGVEVDSSTPIALIPDGVRYTREMRDSLLYRGMMAMYNFAMILTGKLPNGQRAEYWLKESPFLTHEEIVPVISFTPFNTTQFLYSKNMLDPLIDYGWLDILAITYIGTDGKILPVSIKNNITQHLLDNHRISQRPDMYATVNGVASSLGYNMNVVIYDYEEYMLTNSANIRFAVVRTPKHPSLIGSVTDRLDIPHNWEKDVFQWALHYAFVENQDDGSLQTNFAAIQSGEQLRGNRNAN